MFSLKIYRSEITGFGRWKKTRDEKGTALFLLVVAKRFQGLNYCMT
jgi:hypothetical protein